MTDTTIHRALLERLLSEMERTNAKTLAQFGVGMIDLNVIAALRSALEQPQQRPELPLNDEIEKTIGYRLPNFGFDKVRQLMVEYAEKCGAFPWEQPQQEPLADALLLLRVAIQTGHPEYGPEDWIDMIDTALAGRKKQERGE